MGEIMTIEEIKERFPAEWVFVEDAETTEVLEVIRGKVLWHSKDKDELYDKMAASPHKSGALVYTGVAPKDMVFVL
ncbi:MAG TPA: hypothetical protein VJ183_07690 [Chloroflexia bacterium]|nr:hypothetical protein [Chloroflexia bacterium]